MTKPPAASWSVPIFLCAIALITLGSYELYERIRLERAGNCVEAQIVDKYVDAAISAKPREVVVLQYTTQTGEVVQAKSGVGPISALAKGAKIPICYDRNAPQSMQVMVWREAIYSWLFIFIGCAFLYVIRIFARERKRYDRHLQATRR